jgi:hypothetical protein
MAMELQKTLFSLGSSRNRVDRPRYYPDVNALVHVHVDRRDLYVKTRIYAISMLAITHSKTR